MPWSPAEANRTDRVGGTHRMHLFPRMSRRLTLALAALALVITATISATPRPAQAFVNCNVADLSMDSEELAFLQQINNYRAQNGVGALTASVNLNRGASWMAVDLATRSDNVFSHIDSLGRGHQQRGNECDAVGGLGENIA